MRKTRVYVSQALSAGREFDVRDETAHHLLTVLRVRQGFHIEAFDGHGGYYPAEVISTGRRELTIRTADHVTEERESPLRLTLAQSISRGQKMDYTIQKAVELGVHRIVPLYSEFSNVRLDEDRARRRYEHWQRIIINACEQCGRNRLPELLAPLGIGEWLDFDDNPVRLVLHPYGADTLSRVGTKVPACTLLCGPEGGLSEPELARCMEAGYRRIVAGPRILRTETAAVAALVMCQTLWGDMCAAAGDA